MKSSDVAISVILLLISICWFGIMISLGGYNKPNPDPSGLELVTFRDHTYVVWTVNKSVLIHDPSCKCQIIKE